MFDHSFYMHTVTTFLKAAPYGVLMGLDLGDKTIGCALTDKTQLIASSYQTIRRLTLKRDFKALVALEKTLDIKGYVLGLPLNTDGSTNKRTHKTREFGLYFSQYTDQPLLYIDESHSTQEARSHLKEAALKTKKHKHYLDKLAAQIILERYLLEARKLKASS